MSLPRMTFLGILAGSVIWCGLIVAAPLLALDNSPVASMIYDGFHRVCHQFEDRSLHLAGEPLPVCIRCAAIYFSFLAGVLAYPAFRRLREPRVPSRAIVIGAVVPMVVDVVSGMIGVHDVSTATRLFTGALFGSVIAFVVLPVAIEAVDQILSPSPITKKPKGLTDA
jgi:uncharacterized membrane protein